MHPPLSSLLFHPSRFLSAHHCHGDNDHLRSPRAVVIGVDVNAGERGEEHLASPALIGTRLRIMHAD